MQPRGLELWSRNFVRRLFQGKFLTAFFDLAMLILSLFPFQYPEREARRTKTRRPDGWIDRRMMRTAPLVWLWSYVLDFWGTGYRWVFMHQIGLVRLSWSADLDSQSPSVPLESRLVSITCPTHLFNITIWIKQLSDQSRLTLKNALLAAPFAPCHVHAGSTKCPSCFSYVKVKLRVNLRLEYRDFPAICLATWVGTLKSGPTACHLCFTLLDMCRSLCNVFVKFTRYIPIKNHFSLLANPILYAGFEVHRILTVNEIAHSRISVHLMSGSQISRGSWEFCKSILYIQCQLAQLKRWRYWQLLLTHFRWLSDTFIFSANRLNLVPANRLHQRDIRRSSWSKSLHLFPITQQPSLPCYPISPQLLNS